MSPLAWPRMKVWSKRAKAFFAAAGDANAASLVPNDIENTVPDG